MLSPLEAVASWPLETSLVEPLRYSSEVELLAAEGAVFAVGCPKHQ